MKEWKLRILIGFSLVGIIGLLMIQGYWIRDAIEIKELQFRQSVDQAVTNVVWKLERMAVDREEEWKREQERQAHVKRLLLDSLVRIQQNIDQISFPALTQSPSQTRLPRDPGGIISEGLPYLTEYDDSVSGAYYDSERDYLFGDPFGIRFEQYSDSLIQFINQSLEQKSRFANIREYLEELFEDGMFAGSSRDPEELLDSLRLHDMIDVELQTVGIRSPFRYAVYAPFTGRVMFADPEYVAKSATRSGYVYNLFPNFNLSKPIHLILTFPEEKKYLFASLGTVMSLSVFLTVLLGGSLYFITRSTYRQKKLGEMKNDFINNMTHEFKTPVSTISLACEAMRDSDVERSGISMENYLRIIDEENKRLGKLAEQILQTALVDKGQLYLSFEETDIHGLIEQVVEKYRTAIELSRGEIGLKLFAGNPILAGDRTHLYNMLSNLVDNAIKYSDGSPDIEILATDTLSELTISIQDQGIGISKANQKRIFEKLYRVPTGNVHNTKGFGLGLSYVKYIVERHHGSIRVESELGKGSRFIVTLPRHAVGQGVRV